MEVLPNLEIIDLALFMKKEKILIIADTHIGYEEALNKQGILIPRFQFREIIKRLNKIITKIKPKKIIINGDIKHEFGTISNQEWRHTLELLDFLLKIGEVILVKGNHDTILGPIAKKREVQVLRYVKIADYLITHGHELHDNIKDIKTIIIGHEHPAVSIRDGPRVEVFKCFLRGEYKRKNLVVLPSFNLVTEGNDLIKEIPLSPYLQQDLTKFHVWIVANKVYKFGELKRIKNLH